MDVCQVVPSTGTLTAMSEGERPWFEVMDERRQELSKSQDDVAYEARQHGAPSTLTGSWISQLRKGQRPLAADVLRGVAGALAIPPETFIEYRLAIARRAFDEKAIGLDGAAANLRVLEENVTMEEIPDLALAAEDEAPLSSTAAAEAAEAALPESEDETTPQQRRGMNP